jgi:hypothetical protein
MINENGGWENWKMEELEKYDCNTRDEVLDREKYWFDLITSSKITQSPSKIPHCSSKITHTSSKLPQKSLKSLKSSSILPPLSDSNDDVNPEGQINVLQCIYCNNIYSRKDNLNRHIQTCKSKQVYDEKMEVVANNEIITINNQLQNNLQHENRVLVPNNHNNNNTSLTTNTNNNNTNTNTMTNSNNITTINNITHPVSIIPLGKENLLEFFSDEEQVKILKKMFGCFIYLVEYVHFSGKFPQFANIRINNLRSNIAYIYNDDDKRFNAYDQNEVIAEVISERLMDITNFFDNVKDKLNSKETNKIQELISEIEEQQAKYKEYQKKVKLMMYNKRHMVNTTI